MEGLEAHYARENLVEGLLEALEKAGKDIERLTPADLAPVDEFHIRGREASIEVAEMAGVRADMRVLDVGSGIGGPSRWLASEFGCQVTGIDLTEAFCRVAEDLARRTGLADRVEYRHGSALEMPFEDGSFDLAWLQHVTMNIPDKPRLFAEVARALKLGGRVAIYEIVGSEPLHYPVPWATDASISFMEPGEKLRAAVEGAGLEVTEWRDVSKLSADWFRVMLEKGPGPLGLHTLLGPRMREMGGNILRNLTEGRIQVKMARGEVRPSS